jgi:hypothetical protein
MLCACPRIGPGIVLLVTQSTELNFERVTCKLPARSYNYTMGASHGFAWEADCSSERPNCAEYIRTYAIHGCKL